MGYDVSQPPTSPVYDYYAIVPHVSKPQVVVLFRDDRWYLPHWEDGERRLWQGADHVNRAMHEHFGLSATTLRCVDMAYDATSGRVERLYEMENRSPSWSPPGRGRWVSHDGLDALDFGIAAHRTALDAWFTEIERGALLQRRPWARRGWLDATTIWIREQLRLSGITLQGVEQVRNWERTCILRVGTDAGPLYYQATPMLADFEPALVRAMADWHQQHFPHLVAVDRERGSMLLQDFGGDAFDQVNDPALLENAMRRLAEMQIGLALRTDALRAMGVPERPLSGMGEQVVALLNDDHALRALEADQIARLRANADDYRLRSAALDLYGIPDSLEHGDFRAGNVVFTEGGYFYCNWARSAIAHPFFTPVVFFTDIRDLFPDDPVVVARLRDAYLQPWSLYKPMEDLTDAFAIAEALAPLYHALSFTRPGTPAAEADRMIPAYLRLL
jgi:hypothetical protein